MTSGLNLSVLFFFCDADPLTPTSRGWGFRGCAFLSAACCRVCGCSLGDCASGWRCLQRAVGVLTLGSSGLVPMCHRRSGLGWCSRWAGCISSMALDPVRLVGGRLAGFLFAIDGLSVRCLPSRHRLSNAPTLRTHFDSWLRVGEVWLRCEVATQRRLVRCISASRGKVGSCTHLFAVQLSRKWRRQR